MTELKVTRTIFAGRRIWDRGIYPNPNTPNIDPIIKVADALEKENVPMAERSVVYVSHGAEKSPEPKDAGVGGVIPSPNEKVAESSDNNPITPDMVKEAMDYASNKGIKSVEAFGELTASEQRRYVNELAEDESVSHEDYYRALSDYLSVAKTAGVTSHISKALAEAEEE